MLEISEKTHHDQMGEWKMENGGWRMEEKERDVVASMALKKTVTRHE